MFKRLRPCRINHQHCSGNILGSPSSDELVDVVVTKRIPNDHESPGRREPRLELSKKTKKGSLGTQLASLPKNHDWILVFVKTGFRDSDNLPRKLTFDILRPNPYPIDGSM